MLEKIVFIFELYMKFQSRESKINVEIVMKSHKNEFVHPVMD